jgi:RNA polymerase sigma factor (sigma-70 family)
LDWESERDVISADELAKLWREHGAALMLVCRTRCANPDDCVQEAFVRLASQSPVPDDPVAWLARVARNAAISRARSEGRRKKYEERVASERKAWFEPISSDAYESVSTDEVQSALTQLDESTREIVVAHLWGGLTFRQIAEAFDLSHSSAHRQYAAGLERLRLLLTISVRNDESGR